MPEGNPRGGLAIIEIEIAIEIGKLPGLDFDHDFDTDSELPRFKNRLALVADASAIVRMIVQRYNPIRIY